MENERRLVQYCENCGGILEFDIASQQLKCPYCQYATEITTGKTVQEHDFNQKNISKATTSWEETAKVFTCANCGAQITAGANTTQMTCGYCGASQFTASSQLAGMPPEGVIPFQIDKNAAKEIFRQWIKGRFFAPNALKHIYEEDKFQSIYFPYWTYDANTKSPYTAMGGQAYFVTVGSGKEQRTERRIRWYPVSGTINKFFDDVLVAGSDKGQLLMDGADNFNTRELKPFTEAYLSGFIAEKYTLDPQTGLDYAKEKMQDSIHYDVRAQVLTRYDEVTKIKFHTDYKDIKFKHVLFPAWIAGYSFNQKFYTVTINGQNGNLKGTYPKSPYKIILAILVVCTIVLCIHYILVS